MFCAKTMRLSKIANTHTEIFMAIFALAERLTTSATLPLSTNEIGLKFASFFSVHGREADHGKFGMKFFLQR